MGMAEMADCPVLLVGDIDRGGVFAQLYGTVELLESDERARVKGLIINKFRGDVEILKPGLTMLEELTDIDVIGVAPYADLRLDDEDSLSERLDAKKIGAVDIAVIRFPRISNFTDFTAFEQVDGVSVRYVKTSSQLGDPDMVILPGTKNTIADLLWMRRNGFEAAVMKLARKETVIFGICGGYQMLGETITDENGAEYGGGVRGMGLLPTDTVFETEKKRMRVTGKFENILGTLKPLLGKAFSGYEIHMGRTNFSVPAMCAFSDGGADGVCSENIYGTYVHGIFDECAADIARCLAEKKGLNTDDIRDIDMKEFKEKEYDKLADIVRASLDMKKIYEIIGLGD